MNPDSTCRKLMSATSALAAWHCPRGFRRMAACVLLGIMLLNFVGEGSQLFKIILAQYDVTPSTLIAGIFSRRSEPPVKSCCSGKAKPVQVKSCSCPDCGDNCPMGSACTCSTDGHHGHKTDGLFFTMPGCHPEDADGAHYLPLSIRVAFVLHESLVPVASTGVIAIVYPGSDRLTSRSLKPLVPPPRTAAA